MIPTGLQTETHFADSTLEVVERPNRHGKAWQNPSGCEHQQNFVAMDDEKDGILVANFGLYEYEVLPDRDNAIAVTLLRCTGEMGDWGDFPTPAAQLPGTHTVAYEIVPYKKEDVAAAFTEGHLFQTKLSAVSLASKRGYLKDGAGCMEDMGGKTLPLRAGFFKWSGEGLNLTWEVRNGIVCHTKGTPAATLEGQVVRLADQIAYINHDIEDAIRGGVIYPMDISLEISNVLGFTHSERINTLVTDVVRASLGQKEICQSPAVCEAMETLKDFMFSSVYTNPVAKGEEGKAQDMLRRLFEHYQKNPDELPCDFQAIRAEEGVDRAVCDYIAGMTDPFAADRFKELFIPKGWTVL